MQSIATQDPSLRNTQLCNRAKDVVAVAEELKDILVRFTTGKKGRLRYMAAYWRRMPDIKALELRLEKTQKAFDSTVLRDLWWFTPSS